MTITHKLQLSFAIFIGSLLIPAAVGVKAISVIRAYQQSMLDISDLSFTQMKLASAIDTVTTIHQLPELDDHRTEISNIQQLFSEQLKPLKRLNDPLFQTYTDIIIADEKALSDLSEQLFNVRSEFISSQQALQQQLTTHHTAPAEFVELIKLADDQSIIELLVNINQAASYALFTGMKEPEVSIWLEALATLKQKMLHNPKLVEHHPLIEQRMTKRREFVQVMVDVARQHIRYSDQQDTLIEAFAQTVKRNIEHGQQAKKQLLQNIEATATQTVIAKGAVIVVMLLIGILISIYLTRSITQSIATMKRAVEKVGGGDLDFTMEVKGNNEFTTLALSFNQMTRELHAARQEMAQYNKLLELRISERTVELKNAIDKVEINNKALEKLSAQLSKYLSPQLYQSIFSGKRDVVLETSRKKLTVFFSDIQGFTQLTDTMDPEAMTMVLNVYLNAMTEIALEYGGTIDKFIGDAVMVFFGDPETKGIQQDALACVNMAMAMRAKMAELKAYWQTQGYKLPFHIRMGINTGYCTVGNFGAEDRMDYTIIGGNVNLASRLESSAKPDQILISQSTEQLVKEQVQVNRLEEIMVKGIAMPIQTYEVIDHLPDHMTSSHHHYQQPGLDIAVDLNKIDKEIAVQQLKAMIDVLDPSQHA